MEKRTTETQAITPEQRQTYREKLLASLQVARRYDGTEQSFNQLIDTVNTLDHWMRDTFGSGAAIPIQKEMELARTSGTKRDHSINSILDIADAQLRQCLEGPKSLDDMLRELKIAFTEIDQVLLPTNPKSPPPGGGEWEEAVIEPRLQRLILTLQKHHIFIDDILVTKGAVDPAQMRKQPYVLVEIPRIGREVLVCNQVGEATFVSRRHLALQTYLTLPKEALEQVEGVERIVSRGTGKWEVDVMEALLKELPEGEMKKIDVRDVESLRREILKKIPTGVEWVAMTRPIRKKFSIAGRGEVAIATAFGVDHGHDPRGSQYAHAQLGTRIFGEDDPAIHAVLRVENEWQGFEINPVKLKNEIRRRIPTAQEWIAMQSNQKKVFRIGGRGELAIAKTLGVSLEQDPCGYPYPHALLGSAIYGEEDPAIQATLKEEREWQELEKDTAKLKAEIRRKIPTAQEWMKMNRHEKYSFKIAGRSEIVLAKALGMSFTQDPKGYSYSHALLGAAIYGEEDPAIRETLKEEREWQEFKKDTARLKAEIRRKIPTSQEWVAMTGQQKCSFKIAGRGEKAIASALDISVKESPSGNSYSHALLGTAIYGVKDPALQAMLKEEIEWKELKRDPAKLRAEVRRRMPTGQEWMAMTKKEKKFKIAERGENAIANALGVSLEQDPCANPYSHALLGAAIYGEDDPAIQAALRRAKKNEDE